MERLNTEDDPLHMSKYDLIDKEILQKGFEPQEFYFYLQKLKGMTFVN